MTHKRQHILLLGFIVLLLHSLRCVPCVAQGTSAANQSILAASTVAAVNAADKMLPAFWLPSEDVTLFFGLVPSAQEFKVYQLAGTSFDTLLAARFSYASSFRIAPDPTREGSFTLSSGSLTVPLGNLQFMGVPTKPYPQLNSFVLVERPSTHFSSSSSQFLVQVGGSNNISALLLLNRRSFPSRTAKNLFYVLPRFQLPASPAGRQAIFEAATASYEQVTKLLGDLSGEQLAAVMVALADPLAAWQAKATASGRADQDVRLVSERGSAVISTFAQLYVSSPPPRADQLNVIYFLRDSFHRLYEYLRSAPSDSESARESMEAAASGGAGGNSNGPGATTGGGGASTGGAGQSSNRAPGGSQPSGTSGSASSGAGTGQARQATNDSPTAPIREVDLPVACEHTDGNRTHYLQDPACTGANRLEFPLGIFTLRYNSAKPEDKFYGLAGYKHSFHEYITGDLQFYVTASDQKIALTKTGTELNASYVWGDYRFTLSGGIINRDDESSGLRYSYRKVNAGDAIYRLHKITLLSDNSTVVSLAFAPTAGYDLTAISYRPSRESPQLRTITFSVASVNVGAEPRSELRITYGGDAGEFKDATLTFNQTGLRSLIIANTVRIGITNARASTGTFFPYRVVTLTNVAEPGKPVSWSERRLSYQYSRNGALLSRTQHQVSADGVSAEMVESDTYTYTQNNQDYVVKRFELGVLAQTDTYRRFGDSALPISSSTPYGDDRYEYRPAAPYILHRVWSAQWKQWNYELLTFEKNRKVEKIDDLTIAARRNGDSFSREVRNAQGEVLTMTQVVENDASTWIRKTEGLVEVTKTRTKDPAAPEGYRTTTVRKIDGKVVENMAVNVAENSADVRDRVRGTAFSRQTSGDSTTETYTRPGMPPLIRSWSRTNDQNRFAYTQQVKRGSELIAESQGALSSEKNGVSWWAQQRSAQSGAQSWRQLTKSYDPVKEETNVSESFVAAVGGR